MGTGDILLGDQVRVHAWLLRILSDRDDRMNVGKNQTLQKIPGPKKNLIKITCQIS